VQKETRIAVWGAHLSWDGGIDFLHYLVNGLNAIKEERNLKIFLILPYDWVSEAKLFLLGAINSLSSGKKISFKKYNINPKMRKAFAGSRVEIVYYNYLESSLQKKLRDLKIDVLFPVVKNFAIDFSIPWVGYIPDLQHKALPHFFSGSEIKSRDSKYKTIVNTGKPVIVNSIAVRDEIGKYYGKNDNVYNLSFLPPEPDLRFKNYNLEQLKKKYDLPEKYFIISNQFWKHKDHLTAFKALKIVLDKGVEAQLLCTGKMRDERFPEYIQELKGFISGNNLQEKIRLLGFISKEDQMALIDSSVALIQPTLFEGGPGGGAVYNAVTLGAPCIVSDIPVNREITNSLVTFFTAGSPEDLAEKMIEKLHIQREKPAPETLIQQGFERRKQLGRELFSILQKAIEANA
jgi:glycosyltransferase involved in cell wall biosynthesis